MVESYLPIRLLATWRERLRGLLGTDKTANPVMLVRCDSIHTFGMRYALDIAFVSRDGRVLQCRRCVPPGRVVSFRSAFYVLERPARQDPWFQEGDVIEVGVMSGRGVSFE